MKLIRLASVCGAFAALATGAFATVAAQVGFQSSGGLISSIDFSNVTFTATAAYSNVNGLQMVIEDTYGTNAFLGNLQYTGDFSFSVNGGAAVTNSTVFVRGQQISGSSALGDSFIWGIYSPFSFVAGDTITFSGTLTPVSSSILAPVTSGIRSAYLRTVEVGAQVSNTISVQVNTAVPEPSSFAALAGLGALVVATTRRSRR